MTNHETEDARDVDLEAARKLLANVRGDPATDQDPVRTALAAMLGRAVREVGEWRAMEARIASMKDEEEVK